MNILDKLISIKGQLPHKQQVLCNYLLNYPEDIGIFTVKELANKAGVGTTTVMRLVESLGYESFIHFRKEFHHIQVDYSNKWESVQESFLANDGDYASLTNVWQESVFLLDQTLTPQLTENFQKAMDLIEKAKRINLLGLRPYKAVAIYMELLIEEFLSKTRQLSYDSDSMLDRILQFEENEVFIVFGFDPLLKRTLDAASVAYEKGVPVILITDYLSSPIAQYATVILKVECSKKHFSIIPIIALVEAMVIELGKRHSDKSILRMQKLRNVLMDKQYIVD
jgi:DNA-binding MurR/RpiR family transcriptional regulator